MVNLLTNFISSKLRIIILAYLCNALYIIILQKPTPPLTRLVCRPFIYSIFCICHLMCRINSLCNIGGIAGRKTSYINTEFIKALVTFSLSSFHSLFFHIHNKLIYRHFYFFHNLNTSYSIFLINHNKINTWISCIIVKRG